LKFNLPYFQHYSDSHNQPQFNLLRAKYGWAGEGKYWALKNIIASSDNCLLDISNPLNLGVYASDLDMEYEEFKKFIDFLCSRDCGLLVRVENYVSCEDIQETFETVMKQRNASRERKLKRLLKLENGTYKLFEISNS
jgi:hypothetical protein